MSLIMFLVGTIIFTMFVVTLIWEKKLEAKAREEAKRELEANPKNYYERYGIQIKKKPKTKKGSQSRLKYYKVDKVIK